MSHSLPSKSQVKNQVIKWLEEENLNPTEMVDPIADLNLGIAINDNEGFNIIFNKNKKDSFFVGTQIKFSKLDRHAFSTLPPERKSKFLQDLNYALLQINVEYLLHPNPENMEYVHVEKHIFFDSISKQKLFDAILLIRRAIELTKWCYQKHLTPGRNSNLPSFSFL
jgi:hypothetical protein